MRRREPETETQHRLGTDMLSMGGGVQYRIREWTVYREARARLGGYPRLGIAVQYRAVTLCCALLSVLRCASLMCGETVHLHRLLQYQALRLCAALRLRCAVSLRCG